MGKSIRQDGWIAHRVRSVGVSAARSSGKLLAFGALLVLLVVSGSAAARAQEKKPSGKPESPPDAVALYADAANFQNNGAFDLAVDEWQKFLKKYPKDALTPKAQHYLGVCQLQLKRYADSAASFAIVVKDHPKFELLEDAYLNLAWSQYSLASPDNPKPYDDAQATFATLLQKYPKGKYVDQGAFFQGECLYHQGKKKEAIAAYEKVVKDFPKSSLRVDAAYALGVTQEELQQFADAGQTYDLFLKDYADSPLAHEVRMRKAETVLQAGQFGDAEKQFGEVAKIEGFAQADYALFRQAFCQVKQKKFAEAATTYARVVESYANSQYAAEATFSAGTSHYLAGQDDEATKWLQKAIDAGKASAPEAAHWLCRVYLRGKKPADALALAQKLIPAAQGAMLVLLKMDQADALYDLPEKRSEAVVAYRKLAAEHPEADSAPQALYNSAFGAMELKQYDDALKDAAEFLKQFKTSPLLPDVLFVQAESLLLTQKLAEAQKAYRELLEAHEAHADRAAWTVRFGIALSLDKKHEDVVKLLAPAVAELKTDDQKAEAQYLIGASQFALDQFADAAKALNASIAASPKWRQADEALLLLARCQAKQKQPDEAKATLKKVLADFPQSKLLDQAHYRLGEIAYAAEDFAGAIAAYDVVIDKFSESSFVPYARYGKGWSQLKSKDYAASATTFSGLLDKSPEHSLAAETRLARGMARRQAGDAKGAVADLDQFLKGQLEPRPRSDARYERGLAQVSLQDFAGAAETFATLLKDDPKYELADRVVYELGWAYKSQDKTDESVAQFARLTTDFPDSPLAAEAYFHVGESYYAKKEYGDAAKQYASARGKKPTGELAEKTAYKLGWSHFQQKQYQAALDDFTEQVTAHPQGPLSADGLFMKAECLFKLEKYSDALSAFKAAQSGDGLSETSQALILLHGGQSAGQLKQWKDSLALLTQLPAKFPESPFLAESAYERGVAQQNLGDTTAALKEFETAADARDRVGAQARFMIGELRFGEKQYDEAIKEFQRVMFGFGGDNAPADVKTWQAKSGFEAGRCWEVQITSAPDAAKKSQALAQAKKAYGYVVEKHPQDAMAADAKKRLAQLEKL